VQTVSEHDTAGGGSCWCRFKGAAGAHKLAASGGGMNPHCPSPFGPAAVWPSRLLPPPSLGEGHVLPLLADHGGDIAVLLELQAVDALEDLAQVGLQRWPNSRMQRWSNSRMQNRKDWQQLA